MLPDVPNSPYVMRITHNFRVHEILFHLFAERLNSRTVASPGHLQLVVNEKTISHIRLVHPHQTDHRTKYNVHSHSSRKSHELLHLKIC